MIEPVALLTRTLLLAIVLLSVSCLLIQTLLLSMFLLLVMVEAVAGAGAGAGGNILGGMGREGNNGAGGTTGSSKMSSPLGLLGSLDVVGRIFPILIDFLSSWLCDKSSSSSTASLLPFDWSCLLSTDIIMERPPRNSSMKMAAARSSICFFFNTRMTSSSMSFSMTLMSLLRSFLRPCCCAILSFSISARIAIAFSLACSS